MRSKVQVLIMVKNAEDSIGNTIKSYQGKVYRIKIFDTGSTDNTVSIVESLGYKVNKIHFEDFSQARNECLDKSVNNTDFTMFVDDSYELGSSLDILDKIPKNVNCISVTIKRGTVEYNSKRIIRTNSKLRYYGSVHEDIRTSFSFVSNIILNDVYYPRHLERTRSRLFDDIKMLSGKKDPRSVYFYANMLFKLLERQLVHYNVVKNAYDYRISMCTDPEEEFICCMNNGLILAVNEDPEFERYYILASLRFPPRRCESYFYLWLCTNKEKYLELAYKSCEPCKSRMPKDESLYSENGLIAKKYFEVKNSCQL